GAPLGPPLPPPPQPPQPRAPTRPPGHRRRPGPHRGLGQPHGRGRRRRVRDPALQGLLGAWCESSFGSCRLGSCESKPMSASPSMEGLTALHPAAAAPPTLLKSQAIQKSRRAPAVRRGAVNPFKVIHSPVTMLVHPPARPATNVRFTPVSSSSPAAP